MAKKPPRRPARDPAPAAPADARAKLIAAGFRVLSERGYEAATVKEVAKEAGVNQGLVHYYFGSKDGLLLAVTDEAFRQYTQELERLREQTPVDELADASFAFGERVLREAPEQYRLRFELIALGLRNRELREPVSALAQRGSDEVARAFARVRGGPDAAVDAVDRQLSSIVLACFDGLALRHLLDPHFDPQPAFELLRELLMGTVQQQRGAPARKPRTRR